MRDSRGHGNAAKDVLSHSDFPFAPRVNKRRQRSRAALILLESPSNIAARLNSLCLRERNTGLGWWAATCRRLDADRRVCSIWCPLVQKHQPSMVPARETFPLRDVASCITNPFFWGGFYWVFVNWSERASRRPNWFSSLWSWGWNKVALLTQCAMRVISQNRLGGGGNTDRTS